MTTHRRCPHHAVALTFCTLCFTPAIEPHLETHPVPIFAIMGTHQPIPEPDKPEERAGGEFFQQPIQSFVSTTSIADQAFISTSSGLRAFKLK